MQPNLRIDWLRKAYPKASNEELEKLMDEYEKDMAELGFRDEMRDWDCTSSDGLEDEDWEEYLGIKPE